MISSSHTASPYSGPCLSFEETISRHTNTRFCDNFHMFSYTTMNGRSEPLADLAILSQQGQDEGKPMSTIDPSLPSWIDAARVDVSSAETSQLCRLMDAVRGWEMKLLCQNGHLYRSHPMISDCRLQPIHICCLIGQLLSIVEKTNK
jgi:hypothetical protein